MVTLSNPLGFIADIYKDKKWLLWFSELFQLIYSSVVGFLSACGSNLIAGHSWAISIGWGMSTVASIMVIFFIKSKWTKGMLLAVPKDTIDASAKADLEEIQK